MKFIVYAGIGAFGYAVAVGDVSASEIVAAWYIAVDVVANEVIPAVVEVTSSW